MLYFEDNFPSWSTGVNFKKSISVNGITANGNGNIDFSASTGTFKFPSGGVIGNVANVIDVTTSTLTLTAAQSGSTVLLDRAAGSTVTLPNDVAGLTFQFVVATTVTSNSYKVIIGSASSFFQGALGVPVAAGTQKFFYGDASTLLSINLNGTTTGGLFGGEFTVKCLKAGLWETYGNVEGSGTVATPFATS